MRLTLPDGWSTVQRPTEFPSTDLVAIGPRLSHGYAPSAVLTHCEQVDAELDEWAASMVEASATEVTTLHVIDTWRTEIAGHPAAVHLLTMTIDSVNLTQLQFALIAAPKGRTSRPGYVVTTTCASADFADMFYALAGIAASFALEGDPS